MRPVAAEQSQEADRGSERIETCFEKLVGRQATEAERTRLYRLRDVLGLKDNDAFWAIVMALEHYDALFREYPERLAQLTERTLQNVRVVCGTAALEQVTNVQRALAETVDASLVQKLVDKPFAVHQVTAALAAVIAFGSLCVHAGYELAAPAKPFWVHASADTSTLSRAFLGVLSVPAGWMAFALLIPVAMHVGRLGWRMAADPLALRRDHAVGWCIVASCLVGVAACVVLLARIA